MEGAPKKPRTVLEALDEAWAKFGAFFREHLVTLNVDEVKRREIDDLLKRDVLVFIPEVKAFCETHKDALEKKDIEYFRKLAPEEFAHVKFEESVTDKAFLFGRVFQSLLKQLEQ